MTITKGKRPRDPNQLAKWIVEQSTSEQVPEIPVQAPPDLSSYMAAMGRKGGMVGRKAPFGDHDARGTEESGC